MFLASNIGAGAIPNNRREIMGPSNNSAGIISGSSAIISRDIIPEESEIKNKQINELTDMVKMLLEE